MALDRGVQLSIGQPFNVVLRIERDRATGRLHCPRNRAVNWLWLRRQGGGKFRHNVGRVPSPAP